MYKHIAVFCASSKKVGQVYYNATADVAMEFVKYGYTALYGGGGVGLMGKLADVMLENNGNIVGIIPEFMVKLGWAHKSIENLIVVNDMHERKKRLIYESDAVLALPGGVGTLDELLEVITLKQLGKYLKPVIILNTDGFYNPLLDMFNNMVTEEFMHVEHRNIWTVIEHPDEIHFAINNSPSWGSAALKIAQV